jgi:hypothetical protein
VESLSELSPWWGIARPSPKTSDLTAAKLSRLLLLPWEAKQRAGAFPSLNLYCHSLLEATHEIDKKKIPSNKKKI